MDHLAYHLQLGFGRPSPHLWRRLPMRVRRRIPLEIDVVELVQVERRVVERIENMSIEEALDVDPFHVHSEQAGLLGNLHLDPNIIQRFAEVGEGQHRDPRLLWRHGR